MPTVDHGDDALRPPITHPKTSPTYRGIGTPARLYAEIPTLTRLPTHGRPASRVLEPKNRPDLEGYERLPRATDWEKCAVTTREKVLVEGKGFVFVSPLTSRHLSTPTLQIAANRGKTRARTRHALCGGWDVELARRAPPPLSLNRFSAAV